MLATAEERLVEQRDRAPGMARREVASQPRLLVGPASCTFARAGRSSRRARSRATTRGRRRTTCARPARPRCPCTPPGARRRPCGCRRARHREPDPVLDGAPRPTEAVVELRCRPVLVGGVTERRDHAGQSRHEGPRSIVVCRVAATDVAGREEHRRWRLASARAGCRQRGGRGLACGRGRSGGARLRGRSRRCCWFPRSSSLFFFFSLSLSLSFFFFPPRRGRDDGHDRQPSGAGVRAPVHGRACPRGWCPGVPDRRAA